MKWLQFIVNTPNVYTHTQYVIHCVYTYIRLLCWYAAALITTHISLTPNSVQCYLLPTYKQTARDKHHRTITNKKCSVVFCVFVRAFDCIKCTSKRAERKNTPRSISFLPTLAVIGAGVDVWCERASIHIPMVHVWMCDGADIQRIQTSVKVGLLAIFSAWALVVLVMVVVAIMIRQQFHVYCCDRCKLFILFSMRPHCIFVDANSSK